jgi:hypothetical protein
MEAILRKGDEISLACMDCPVFVIQELVESQGDEECISYWKTTEGAWFTAEEAEGFAKSIGYRLWQWRVYAIGARGQLKDLLKAHTQGD